MIEDWTSFRYTDHRLKIYGAFLLGLMGLAASVATIYALPLEGTTSLSCGIEQFSFSTALKSQFSKVFGIPLGIFGVFYFAFWLLNLRAFQMTSNEGYLCSLSWVALLGAVGSLVLAIIMFLVLKAPCLYCFLAHIANIGSFLLLWPVRKWRMSHPFSSEQFRHFTALTGIALLSATTLFFANQSRHLSASLQLRNDTIAAFTETDFAGQLKTHDSFAAAQDDAIDSDRLIAIGFFNPD